ncbi:MAG: hypothetical protein NTX41_01690 [Verrucomicrobia bacterium]|nr:hypothetical protein [Verrucomicrobiota bacterium]
MQPAPPMPAPFAPRQLMPVGVFTTWILLFAYVVLTLPTQWVRAVLPYYGDVVFAVIMLVVAIPYLIMRSFWLGTSKWAVGLMVYGMIITYLTRGAENTWAFGQREFILDGMLFLAVAFGLKLGEASFASLRTIVSRVSWVCVLMGAANILLMRFGYVQIDADASNRVVSISLFYIISPLLFLVPLQIVFRLGLLLPVLSVAMVGLVAYFTLTRSIAIAFFLLFAQLLLLLLRRAMGAFATGFTVWLFLILPLMGLGGYYMLDSITDARGMDSIADTTGRNLEFEAFLEQMTPRGWVTGNGLGTGFQMDGYDPETGLAMKVITTGLHFSTLTPVLKLGAVLTLFMWLALLYASARVFFGPGEVEQKAVVLVPFNYIIVYSISGGWLASAYLIFGVALCLIFNFRAFAEAAAPAAQPHSPDGRPLLYRRHRHL